MGKGKGANKIVSFPKGLREEIDGLILAGKANKEVRDYIENNNKEFLVSIPTIKAYRNLLTRGTTKIVPMKDQMAQEEKDLLDIQQEQAKLDSSYIQDKGAYIDILILKVNRKLCIFDELDRIWKQLDLKKERVYQAYISSARELVETKARLSGEVSSDTNIMVNITQDKIDKFNKIVHETLKEICPEKLMQFQEVFKKKWLEMKDEALGFAKKIN